MRCSRGAKGRQANAAKPEFFPGKLIYDHKKRSCGTGHTISTILKHEFRKKDQDGMGKVREVVVVRGSLPVLGSAKPVKSLFCSSPVPMDSAAQNARAELTQQQDSGTRCLRAPLRTQMTSDEVCLFSEKVQRFQTFSV